jgi:hypothetical protein
MIITTPGGKAELKWNIGFQKKWQGRFDSAQEFVDSECIRLTEPFVPKRTGMLEKSGILGSVIGSGKISYIAPYAKKQYYLPNRKKTSNSEPLRGSFWFARSMALNKKTIEKGMEPYLKGKKKK